MTVADKDNKNIVNSTTAGDVKHIKVYKVAELANWTYDDEALGAEWKTILEDLKNFPRWSTSCRTSSRPFCSRSTSSRA